MAQEELAQYGNEGLGLAEAAGLVPGQEEPTFNLLEWFWKYFHEDLISSIPITICSFLVILVIIERALFYNRNNRDISKFIQSLQHQLEKGDLESAQMLASQLNSVIGEVAEEGIRLLAVQKEDFGKAYDITVHIVTRKLQKFLPILATVGAVAPFLGLFGTVSGVIKALFNMAMGSEGASLSMVGEISNALVATGFGLAIAIIAVICNNLYNNIVRRYEDDFMLMKLLFLSFSSIDFGNLRHQFIENEYNMSHSHQDAHGQQYHQAQPQQHDQHGGMNQPEASTQQQPNVGYNSNASTSPNANSGSAEAGKPPYPDFLK